MSLFVLVESYKPERTTVEPSGIESMTLETDETDKNSDGRITTSSTPFLSYVAIVVAPTANVGKPRSARFILWPNASAATDTNSEFSVSATKLPE